MVFPGRTLLDLHSIVLKLQPYAASARTSAIQGSNLIMTPGIPGARGWPSK